MNSLNVDAIGADSLNEVERFIPVKGRILVITSPSLIRHGLLDKLLEHIDSKRTLLYDSVKSNPSIVEIDNAISKYSHLNIRCIIAIGGGSVIDFGKILSVTLPLGLDKPLAKILNQEIKLSEIEKIRLVSIPSTAGSGAEVTPFSTIWDYENKNKYSINSIDLIPDIIILDPKLTSTQNEQLTVISAMDAISHSLESIWNRYATPKSIDLAFRALEFLIENLPLAIKNPNNLNARLGMQKGALLAGRAISITRTSVAHSISYPLTSYYQVPHGLACGFTLIELLKINMSSLKSTYPNNQDILERALLVIQSLNLADRILHFASAKQILELEPLMYKEGRIDNYMSEVGLNINSIISSSLIK